MPAKNSVKQYVENSYYHLYNRGVEKRQIFLDNQDYSVFLHYLKLYLSDTLSDSGFNPNKSLSKEVDLLAFCLMPNHFHLLIKQNTKNAITRLMRGVCTRYSMYFNTKYRRVGGLFQGIYKAVLIDQEPYLLHLSRYIHLNPSSDSGFNPESYNYSSYQYYLGQKHAGWLKPEPILSFFKSAQKSHLKECLSYQSFVEDSFKNSAEILGDLILEA